MYYFYIIENGILIHSALFSNEAEAETYSVLYIRDQYPELVAELEETHETLATFNDLAAAWGDLDFAPDWDILTEIVFETAAQARSFDAAE